MNSRDSERQPDQQTSMILSPEETRNTPNIDATTRGKVKTQVNKIEKAKYQGLGPNGLVVAIAAENETEIRRNLIDAGIIVKQDRLDCDHPWVGIPEKHTLYEVKEIAL